MLKAGSAYFASASSCGPPTFRLYVARPRSAASATDEKACDKNEPSPLMRALFGSHSRECQSYPHKRQVITKTLALTTAMKSANASLVTSRLENTSIGIAPQSSS